MYLEEQSKDDLDKYNYIRQMGAYKPHFQGVADSYFPLSCIQICKYIFLLFIIIVLVLVLLISFQFWVVDAGLQSFVITWVTVLIIFLILSIILLYKGGKDRRALEKAMIEQNTKKQKEMMKMK